MIDALNKISTSISIGFNKVGQDGERIRDNVESGKTKELVYKAVSSVSANKEKLSQYFSESGLSDKMKEYGKKIGSVITYPVILLYSAFKSTATPAKEKLLITSCLGYFILPTDLIPDIIAGVGFADDAAAITACLAAINHILTPEIYEEANNRIRSIFGEVDEDALKKITDKALKLANQETENRNNK